MEELKKVIGKNIIELRKKMRLTQAELAEKINYSDKAVSKWECGDAVPDIAVLKQLAELLGVTVDYLLHESHEEQPLPVRESNTSRRNKRIITALSVSLVWLVATLLFVIFDYTLPDFNAHWLTFVYAVPVSFTVTLVFNSIWGKKRRNFAIITGLVWSFLASVYLTFLQFNLWLIFMMGIPAQIIIILWSGIKKVE